MRIPKIDSSRDEAAVKDPNTTSRQKDYLAGTLPEPSCDTSIDKGSCLVQTSNAASSERAEPQSKTHPTQDITIQPYTAEDLLANTFFHQQLIQAYRNAFGGAPWNEWKLCPCCGAKYSRIEHDALASDDCRRCSSGTLVDYHPPARVAERLISELTLPGASPFLFVAQTAVSLCDSRVLGFVWGYGRPIAGVVEEVMRRYFADLPADVAAQAITKLQQSLLALSPSGTATYVSEIAVVDGSRGSAMLFARLLQALIEHQIAHGHTIYVHWTSRKSRGYSITQLLGGVEVYAVGEDAAGDDRVLMAGDCIRVLNLCYQYPGAKMVSYFVKEMRAMKQAGSYAG